MTGESVEVDADDALKQVVREMRPAPGSSPAGLLEAAVLEAIRRALTPSHLVPLELPRQP